jgi:DNA invertase Pin-like site-specific DNA recombinase
VNKAADISRAAGGCAEMRQGRRGGSIQFEERQAKTCIYGLGARLIDVPITATPRYRTAQRRLGSCVREALAMRIVAYERVSTARQGRSGLGLEAQRKAIDDFAASRSADVIARFTEIESGRNPDRPELGKALHLAKVTGATLVIAKLDRLSRNAAFLLALRDSGVSFLAADMPEANDLTIGIMALVAQQERDAISRRTKEALAAAKARGVKLGNPNGAAALRRAGRGGEPLRNAIDRNADAFARDLAPIIADIRAEGAKSLRAIAEELTIRGVRTRRGGRWGVSNVGNLLERIGH